MSWYEMISQESLLPLDSDENEDRTENSSLKKYTSFERNQWTLDNITKDTNTQQQDTIIPEEYNNDNITDIESYNHQKDQQYPIPDTEINSSDRTKEKIQTNSILKKSNSIANEKFQTDTVWKNSKTVGFEKFQNRNIEQDAIIDNFIEIWQKPNSLRPNTKEETINDKDAIESPNGDSTFLDTYTANFATINNVEEIKNSNTRCMTHQNDTLNFNEAREIFRLQKENTNKIISRDYSFCYGHIPYTAIFITFAPYPHDPSKTHQTKLQGAKITDKFPDSKKAHAILVGVAQNAGKHQNYGYKLENRRHKRKVPNIGFPWKPRKMKIIQQGKNTDLPEQKLNNTHIQDESETTKNELKDQSGTYQKEEHCFTPNNFLDDVRNEIDKEVDRVQEFNDKILQSNGFKILSFMKTNMNPQIYAGALITELDQGIFMYICKPCDMTSFEQKHFLTHLASPKHQNNTISWIMQHYILQEPKFDSENNETIIRDYRKSVKDSNYVLTFNHIMKIINDPTLFPEKHKINVAFLITKFFTETNIKDIQFSHEFTKDRDDQDQEHWIISAFKEVQRKQYNIRQYLIDKSKLKDFEFFKKSPKQTLEVEVIADLARILFRMLVECEFIPTGYLTILAIIMSTTPTLEYPQSKLELFNFYYMDLILEEGIMILANKYQGMGYENQSRETKTHIEQNPDEKINTIPSRKEDFLPDSECRRFIDHCNFESFDWKVATFFNFQSKLEEWYPQAANWTPTNIHDLKSQMLLCIKTHTYDNPENRSKDYHSQIKRSKQAMFQTPTDKKQYGDGGLEQLQNAYGMKSVISRDVDDGNFPNYCQAKGGGLVKSSMGFALCNYCGLPLHKRQNCFIKSQDRIHGLDRIVHPEKSSNMWKAQNSLPWHKTTSDTSIKRGS